MALKKYRFATGICGPTILYSNTIRAEDEIAAAKIYLTETGKEITDESISELLRHISEIVPKETPDQLFDCMGREISEDDDVAVIKSNEGAAPELSFGKIEKISGKSVSVKTPTGESVRVMLTKSEADTMTRVLVMGQRPAKECTDVFDGSGYPLQVGDRIAYMDPAYFRGNIIFKVGTVEKITPKTIMVNGTRKTPDRTVVINW